METQPKKILIIEDDRFISEMYARTLRKNGYEVVESVTGPDGFAKAQIGGWSYILLDIMLPDKTGVEILEELRGADKAHGDTKIIIITNFEQDDATRQSMEKLADGYLIKAEITPRRMLEIIQEMEQQAAAASAPKKPDEAPAAPAAPEPAAQPASPEQEVKEEPETTEDTPSA